MIDLDVDKAIQILNSGDAEAREAYLLEVRPDAFARGRIYIRACRCTNYSRKC